MTEKNVQMKAKNGASWDALFPVSKAANIAIEDVGNHFTSDDVEGALSELFQSVSNRNALIAEAITDKGVPTSATDPAQTMADNITAISSAPDLAGQELVSVKYADNIAANDLVSITETYEQLNAYIPLNQQPVTGVAYSPDGKYIASVNANLGPGLFLQKKVSGDRFVPLPSPAYVPSTASKCTFSSDSKYLAVSGMGRPFLVIYKITTGDVFTKIDDIVDMPQANITYLSFSSNADFLAVSQAVSPYVLLFKRSGDTFTRLSDLYPALTTTITSLDLSSDGTYLAVGQSVSPFLVLYKRSGRPDAFNQITDPATMPTASVLSVAFSPDDAYLAVLSGTLSSRTSIYKRSGDTFTKLALESNDYAGNCITWSSDLSYLAIASSTGLVVLYFSSEILTKLTLPASNPAVSGSSWVDFSPDGMYLVNGHGTSAHGYLNIFKKSGTGASTTYTTIAYPANLPTATLFTSASDDGKYIVGCYSSSPYLVVLKKETDGTVMRLADPTGTAGFSISKVKMSPDGNYFVAVQSVSPFIQIWKRTGDVFDLMSDPANLPTGAAQQATFSQDSTYLVITHSQTPFITIYKLIGGVYTKLDNPTTLPTGNTVGVSATSDMTYLFVGVSVFPFLYLYKRSGDVFTKLPDPLNLPSSSGDAISVSPDSTYVAVGSPQYANLAIYKRSGDTFTRIPDLIPIIFGAVATLYFSPVDNILYLFSNNSFLKLAYDPSTDLFRREIGRNSPELPNTATYRTINVSADGEFALFGMNTTAYPFLIYRRALTAKKIDGLLTSLVTNNVMALGYAKETGSAGETHQIYKLWK
jgi:WD40 repeat protein